MTARLKLHLPKHLIDNFAKQNRGLYRFLHDNWSVLGGAVDLETRHSATDLEHLDPAHFHIVHNGRMRAPHVLNAGFSYLRPYWYLDPNGLYSDSATGERRFDPDAFPADKTARFFEELERRFVTARPEMLEPLSVDDRSVLVLLQGRGDPSAKPGFVEETSMLSGFAQQVPKRSIVIHCDAEMADPEALKLARELAAQHDHIQLSHADVATLLPAAQLVASLGTSACFLALVHRVPVMLFGKSDYHPCVNTRSSLANLADAIEETLATEPPFEAFLFWFLKRQMLKVPSQNMIEKTLRRIERNGFDTAGFGLSLGS